MFFNRKLNSAEKNYWFTELEITCLVWILKKIWHIIKIIKNKTIIYTNHSAILRIIKQTLFSTSCINKLNLCLIQTFQYIQLFNLQIFHKLSKMYLISNILFQFFSEVFSDNIKSFNVFHVNVLHEDVKYTATMIKLSEEFRKYLQDRY